MKALAEIVKEKSKTLQDQSEHLIIQQEDLEGKIKGHSQKDMNVVQEINDSKNIYSQLEKQKAEGLKAIEELNDQYLPLVTEADKEKEKLQKVFNVKLKQLQNEKNKKKLNIDNATLEDVIDEIAKLDPQPGKGKFGEEIGRASCRERV